MSEPPVHRSPALTSLLSLSAEGTPDAFDGFNDDLIWILDKLVDRTGGDFGVLSGHLQQASHATVLALSSSTAAMPVGVCDQVAIEAVGALKGGTRRASDDAAEIDTARFSVRFATNDDRSLRCMQLVFAPTSDVSVVATVCKVEALLPFGPLQHATAARLYPVLSRYVRLWWMHRAERRRANSLSAALDLSDVGVLLLDRRGDLIFANARAQSLMKPREGSGLSEASTLAVDDRERVGLHAAIRRAIHCNLSPPATGRVAARSPVLPLRRGDGRRPLIVTVMSVARAAADAHDPAVIVYVLDPELNVDELLGPACRLYQLTAAETRLVHLLVAGSRLADAARQMSIQLETARAYLKQVFAKTRTNRQVDLVRLMLASAMRTGADVDLAPV